MYELIQDDIAISAIQELVKVVLIYNNTMRKYKSDNFIYFDVDGKYNILSIYCWNKRVINYLADNDAPIQLDNAENIIALEELTTSLYDDIEEMKYLDESNKREDTEELNTQRSDGGIY